MSEYLRSAFNNIQSSLGSNSNNEGTDGGQQGQIDNEFVGQNVDLKGQRLRVERVIAEGIPRLL